MQVLTLDESPLVPVSHNPELKKRVLLGKALSCVRHISHITLKPGDTAVPHSHGDSTEVFYCVSGEVFFIVEGTAVTIGKGGLLIVEPGETHSITGAGPSTEMLYMMIG